MQKGISLFDTTVSIPLPFPSALIVYRLPVFIRSPYSPRKIEDCLPRAVTAHVSPRIESGISARRRDARKNDKYSTRELVSPFARRREDTKTRLERNGGSRNLFIRPLSFSNTHTHTHLPLRSSPLNAHADLECSRYANFLASARACNNFMEISSLGHPLSPPAALFAPSFTLRVQNFARGRETRARGESGKIQKRTRDPFLSLPLPPSLLL